MKPQINFLLPKDSRRRNRDALIVGELGRLTSLTFLKNEKPFPKMGNFCAQSSIKNIRRGELGRLTTTPHRNNFNYFWSLGSFWVCFSTYELGKKYALEGTAMNSFELFLRFRYFLGPFFHL